MTLKRNNMTRLQLLTKIKDNYPYILEWVGDDREKHRSGYSVFLIIIWFLVIGNKHSPKTSDDMFEKMNVTRGKWSKLYNSVYNFIEYNEELIKFRML